MTPRKYLDTPNFVYRFQSKLEFIDPLLEGDIYLSTLGYCRRVEEDPGEGTYTYRSGMVSGHGDDPALQRVAANLGYKIGPGAKDMTLLNNSLETSNYDAWVFCTTLNPEGYCKAHFGPFGVRIATPVEFFTVVTHKLKSMRRLGSCTIAGIDYEPREGFGLDDLPDDANFVKPAGRFRREEELRMLWETPDGVNRLESIVVSCPEIRHLITRIS
jgi:hypothetical protein